MARYTQGAEAHNWHFGYVLPTQTANLAAAADAAKKGKDTYEEENEEKNIFFGIGNMLSGDNGHQWHTGAVC